MEPTAPGPVELVDPVVGRAGDRPLRLSELGQGLLVEAFRIAYGESPTVTKRRVLIRAILQAIEKGVNVYLIVDPYTWCEHDTARPQRISREVCIKRQKAEFCGRPSCLHSIFEKGSRMAKKKKEEAENTQPAEPRVTKTDLLKSAFDETKEWTEEDLLKRTDYDRANLKTAIGLLRNPKRTKTPVNILFDPNKKVYFRGELGDKAPAKVVPEAEATAGK